MELEKIIELAVEDTNRPDLVPHFRNIADSVVRAAHGVEVFQEDLHVFTHTPSGPVQNGTVQILEWGFVGMRGLYHIECFGDNDWDNTNPLATDFPVMETLQGTTDYFGFRSTRGYIRTKGQIIIRGVPDNTTRVQLHGSKFPATQLATDGISVTTDSWIARDYPEILQHGFAIRGHYISGKTDSLALARQFYGELLNQMISTKAGEIYGR